MNIVQIFSQLKARSLYMTAFIWGLASALAFAPVFFLPILVISFSGLLLSIASAANKKVAFLVGWWFGFGFFLSGLYWIAFALLVDIASFAWLIPFAVLGIPAILAIYIGLTALLAKIFSKNKYQLVLNFVAFWLVFEILRVNILTGFPWLLLGYSLCFSDTAIQSASIFGVYGLSFVVLCLACCGYLLLDRCSKRDIIHVSIALFIFAANYGFGYTRLITHEQGFTDAKIRIVQADIKQNLHADFKEKLGNFQKHIDLTKQGDGKGFDFIIWPEAGIDFPLTLTQRLNFAEFIPKDSVLLTGGIRVDDVMRPTKVWNSMFAIDHQGQIVDYYDKAHLVPFGEYIPFKSLLPINKVTHGVIDFSQGAGLKEIKLDQKPSFAPSICYESYFPEEMLQKSRRPDFIINFTNDAWYGNTSGPYQHFHMTRMRAVEQGVPVIRAANTGISAVINSQGQILAKLPLNSSGVIDSYLPKVSNNPSFFNEHGNLLIYYLIFLLFIVVCKEYYHTIKQIFK